MKNEKINFEEIKTFDDALKATGRPDVPEFSDVPAEMREWFKNLYKAAVITEAINGDWKADWTDMNMYKWVPYFIVDKSTPSGFAVGGTSCDCSGATAGDASRLCFETQAKAAHAGRTFVEVFAKIITK